MFVVYFFWPNINNLWKTDWSAAMFIPDVFCLSTLVPKNLIFAPYVDPKIQIQNSPGEGH